MIVELWVCMLVSTCLLFYAVPVMELFKYEIVLMLSDSKYDWLTCARLLDISGSSQMEIEHSYPAKRQLFDVIDAFQIDKKVQGNHTPNVDSLLKELQGKLPQDLSDQLPLCLEKALKFTPPTLGKCTIQLL